MADPVALLLFFFFWLWALVPRAYRKLSAELGEARSELRSVNTRLVELEAEASVLHKAVRERREAIYGVDSAPSPLEIQLVGHLAQIMKMRQNLTPPPTDRR